MDLLLLILTRNESEEERQNINPNYDVMDIQTIIIEKIITEYEIVSSPNKYLEELKLIEKDNY